MANANQSPRFINELGSLSLYKKTQGKLTRQLTFLAVVAVTASACWAMSQSNLLLDQDPAVKTGVPVAIAALISWLAFRMVNYPPFAEFLISVQAEMTKVNWPSWGELKRATIVVVAAMFFLGLVLFVYDFFWLKVLSLIQVLKV